MDILKEKLKEKITSVVNDVEQILSKKDTISLLKELSFYFDMKADEVEKDLNENGEKTFEKLHVNEPILVNAVKFGNIRNTIVTQNDDGCLYQKGTCCEVDDVCCDSSCLARGNING